MTQLSLFDPIEIPLTRGYVAIVDPIDSDLAAYKWFASGHDQIYARRHKGPPPTGQMHVLIARRMFGNEWAEGLVTDHISGDALDNRRCNLRLCTNAQNQYNSRTQRNNKSGFKGVAPLKGSNGWIAQIGINGKRVYLGYFSTPEAAHQAYCDAARKHYGSFARFE